MTRIIAILGASLLLLACAPQVTDAACAVWTTLSYSAADDTEDTIRGIEGNNAAQASYCKK